MAARKSIPEALEAQLLIACGRRCCLCFHLRDDDGVKKGQIAHLNRDPGDARYENLVYLCLDHHDEYDSRTSQSKGITGAELRAYRELLHKERLLRAEKRATKPTYTSANDFDSVLDESAKRFAAELPPLHEPWRFPLWQMRDQPELFAFKSWNADGICLIERIDLPDGRVIVACIQTAGNPGISITNAVEDICFQVCLRFSIDPLNLVWLEHYDDIGDGDWRQVTFKKMPPDAQFSDPSWQTMDEKLWRELQLRPKKRLSHQHGQYKSKLTKLFT